MCPAAQVVALGAGCSRLKLDDAVWADVLVKGGTFAQYVVANENQTGLMPTTLTFAEAGSIPLVGGTGLVALQAADKVAPWIGRPNVTVVVTSGTGGTGFIGVQLAKAMGAARVVTAATGAANIAYCRSIGADVVVDYHKQNLFDVLAENSVDVVYDNFGAKGTADRAMPKVRAGGVIFVLPGGNGGTISKHPKPGVKQIGVEPE